MMQRAQGASGKAARGQDEQARHRTRDKWGLGMAGGGFRHGIVAALATVALTGCVEGGKPLASGGTEVATKTSSTRLVDRDVEAPEVFQVTGQGLWDGRPSLGGVWVATPDAANPERVLIRNTANGKFVIGALFKRERENPGPPIQISSDAAAALGLLAGQPGEVNVTALRRDEAPASGPDATQPLLDGPETVASEAVATEALDTAAVAAAIDKADPARAGAGDAVAATDVAAPVEAAPAKRKWWQRKDKAVEPVGDEAAIAASTAAAGNAPAASAAAVAPAAVSTAPLAPAAPKPAAAPAASGGWSIQLGIFSVEANAKRAADMVTKAGSPANVRNETSNGKPYWSVVAGPAATKADRDALLKKVKDLGFTDAYAVSR
jgi:cell division septation protein DedD